MMAEFLSRIILNNNDQNSVFIWVAPRDLHNQSKGKVESGKDVWKIYRTKKQEESVEDNMLCGESGFEYPFREVLEL